MKALLPLILTPWILIGCQSATPSEPPTTQVEFRMVENEPSSGTTTVAWNGRKLSLGPSHVFECSFFESTSPKLTRYHQFRAQAFHVG